MKKNILFYVIIVLLMSLTSCYEPRDDEEYYYVYFEVDGNNWKLDEFNGTFDSYTASLFEDYWDCDWISNDNSVSFGLYCEPAPDSPSAAGGYGCDVYFYDENTDTRYYSVDGFTMTAWYNDTSCDYRGHFSGPGKKDSTEGITSVVFSEGTFNLEYNSFLDL